MRHPYTQVIRYRIVLDRAEDQTFVAGSLELPGPAPGAERGRGGGRASRSSRK